MKFETFNSDELQSLKLFHNRVGRIWATRIIKENLLGSEIKMTVHRSGEMEVERIFPSEDDLSSFLVHLRPIISKKEPTYYYKIINIVRRRLSEERCRICLNQFVSTFAENIKEIDPRLIVETIFKDKEDVRLEKTEYDSEEIFLLYLNGYYFHDDILKVERLESFKCDYFNNASEIFAKSLFISMAIQYLTFISNVDYFIVSRILADLNDTPSVN